MDAIEQVVLAGQTSSRTARAALSPRLLPAMLAAFVPVALLAIAVAWAAHPLLSAGMVPLLHAVGGDWAFHYPASFVRLPGLLMWLGRWTGWLAMPGLVGFAAMLSAYGGQGLSTGSALRQTLARLPRLLVVGAPLALVRGAAAESAGHAIQSLAGQPVSAVGHLILASALETLVIAVAACALPLALQSNVALRDVPRAMRRAARYGSIAVATLGLGLAAAALVSRIALGLVVRTFVPAHPEVMLAVVLAGALLLGVGIVAFAGSSMLVADAANEAWA